MEFKRRTRPNPYAKPAASAVVPEPVPETKQRMQDKIPGNIKTIAIGFGSLIAVVVIVAIISQMLAQRDASDPSFQTVLPSGQAITSLGGWHRVTPPGDDPVFAYSDTIDSVPISVSEQPLPDAFKRDTASAVADLAKQYNATTKLKAGDVAVYVGTSAKGPQSTILTKHNLLILIKSKSQIDNSSWTDYVSSLN